MWSLTVFYIISMLVMCLKTEDEEIINTIQFPFGGPFMGLFVTLSMPLGLKEEDVFLGYNMEANYNLPENQTSFSYPPILGERAITRSSVYQFLRSKLSSFGYPGYECLQRMICDIAVHPVKFSNGILGDLVHILLTPSSSKDTEYLEDFLKAEEHGNREGNCWIYHKECSKNILDLFSTIIDVESIMRNNKNG